MRHEVRTVPLPSPLATGAGDPIDVGELTDKAVQVTGTFTASIQLQGSLDGTNFEDLGSAISGPDLVVVAERVKWLRVDLTFTSGTPVVLVGGLNERTDI
jgi:hypothetical protein